MRRKIIKQGVATLTISLPAKWTKKYKLNAGDELDVEAKDGSLVIRTGKPVEVKKEVLDLTKIDALIKRIVASKYLKGADEIEIKFDDIKKARVIQQRVKEMIGMEVIFQGKNYLVIKDISGSAEEAFDPILRRVFFMIKVVAEESLKTLKKQETDLSYLEDMEANINSFTDYCIRILNKKGYPEFWKTPMIMGLVGRLEQLADAYKLLTGYITKNKIVLNPGMIKIFEMDYDLFKKFEALFYNFAYANAIAMAKSRDKIISEIDKKIEAAKTPKEVWILKSLREITEITIKLMDPNLIMA